MTKIYNQLNAKALLLVLMTSFFALAGNAQTGDFNVVQFPNADFVGDRDTVRIDTVGSTFFSTSTRYYLYRDIDFSGTLTSADRIMDQSASVTDTILTFIHDDDEFYVYYVAAATGLGSNEEVSIQEDAVSLPGDPFSDKVATNPFVSGFGTLNGDWYELDNIGFRRLETSVIPELDVANGVTATVSFRIFFNNLPLNSNDSIVFEYSTNGTTWVTLIDSLNNGYNLSGGSSTNRDLSISYELPNEAKTATTQFRFRQGPEGANTQKDDYTADERSWYINVDAFIVSIGDEEILVNEFAGNQQVQNPFTNLAVSDTTGGGNFIAGGGFEIDATFRGFIGQQDNFSYVAIFDNGDGDKFSFENADATFTETVLDATGSDAVYAFDIEGSGSTVFPADIPYGDTWEVTIQAFSGATPTLGASEDLLTDATREEYNGEFDGDGSRFLLTEALTIESVTNASLTLDLNKNQPGRLYPAGTEVVVEYTTNGTSFTALIPEGRTEAAISLNDTIDGFLPFSYDLSTITALVGGETQFRVRQLSNSGLDLDTWDIQQFDFATEGTLIENGNSIDYTSTFITIDEPTLVLDPVDVPEGLIFPGSELTLTYNITEGALPEGTTIMAILDGSNTDLMIGTSNLIAPGEDQDHPIEITVPPLVGGTYTISLVTSNELESINPVSLPVFNTTLEITSVTSSNGLTDNGVDIFYPGDEVTVNFEVNGSLGADAELFLQVYDDGNDEYINLSSIAGAAIDAGVITGNLGQDIDGNSILGIDYGDNGDEELRIIVGNGVLTDLSPDILENQGIGSSEIENGDPFVEVVGNNTADGELDNFISSGTRSATTRPYDLSNGGTIELGLNDVGNYEFDQDIRLEASINNGSDFTTIAEETYTGNSLQLIVESLPQELWSDSVIFRVIYNDAEPLAAEFENELDIDYLFVAANENILGTSANTSALSGPSYADQFRSPEVSIEVLSSTSFVVGETQEIEFTSEGNFPANTEFALVLSDDTDPGDATNLAVLATAPATASGTFNAVFPDFAFEDQGTGSDLYDLIDIVAYDATGGAGFAPNEVIDIDDNDLFLILDGTNETNGDYTFDLDGDRDALTVAFDLSGALSATLNFDFYSEVANDANELTIPQLQYSINAGETFVNIEAEDSDLDGGFLSGNGTISSAKPYSVEVPAEAITAATHFRWVQDLNLGQGDDRWRIRGISVVLTNGNEIEAQYNVNNSVNIDLFHPEISESSSGNGYELTEVDPNDATFNGETVALQYLKRFDGSDDFPAGTTFEYLIKNKANGQYEIDPETNLPLRIAVENSIGGAFTATIPSYVGEGAYDVEVIASIDNDGEQYFYYGSDANTGFDTGFDLEVFLRALQTVVTFDDDTDVFYAGNEATFSITLENDETSPDDLDGFFSTLLVLDYPNGGDELVLATQEGVDDFTLNLPPYLRGQGYSFETRLSEGAPLGEVGDILGAGSFSDLEEDPENFSSQFLGNRTYETATYTNTFGFTDSFRVQFDLNNPSGQPIEVYSIENGSIVRLENTFTDVSLSNTASAAETVVNGGTIAYRFVGTSNAAFDVTDIRIETTSDLQVLPSSGSFSNPNPNDPIIQFGDPENGVQDFGRGLITTVAFDAGDLADKELISFDLTFDKEAEDITMSQFLEFEYSTNGGESFTNIATFPDADLEEDEVSALSDENFLFSITDEMKNAESVVYRWRQEERNNIQVEINNFSFLSGREVPFNYASDQLNIANQVILVTSVPDEAVCLEDSVEIGYEIRGQFGADNEVIVGYFDEENIVSDAEFVARQNLVSGTGTFKVLFPSNIFNQNNPGNNKNFRFRLNYDDETFLDSLDFVGTNAIRSTTQAISEVVVEIIAPIDPDVDFSTNTIEVCEGDDVVTVTLGSGIQNGFTYEILDPTGTTVLGTTVYDDTDAATQEIEIGSLEAVGLEEGDKLKVRVSSSCNETGIVSLFEPSNGIEVNEIVVASLNGEELEGTATLTLCPGAPLDIDLLQDGSTYSGTFEWFRNNFNTPLSLGSSNINASDLDNISGTYFARITDGSCTYTTDSLAITFTETPETPEITVVSGNLTGCDDGQPVVLSAPAGFAYYEWSGTGNAEGSVSTVTVDEDVLSANISVRVSNLPFANLLGDCGSATSEPIEINKTEQQLLIVGSFDGVLFADGDEFETCEDGLEVYFFQADGTRSISINANDIVEVLLNGSVIETLNSGFSAPYLATESGSYQFRYRNLSTGLDNPCTSTSNTFTVNVTDQPDQPVISVVSGSLTSCESDGPIVLSAPAGFARYEWTNPSVGSFRTQTITLDDNDDSGLWTVRVSNASGTVGATNSACFSEESEPVEVKISESYELVLEDETFGDNIDENEVIDICSNDIFEFDVDERTSDGGQTIISDATIEIFRDGALVDVSTNPNNIELESISGVYNVVVSDNNNTVCTATSYSFTLNVIELPATPVITVTGNLEGCDTEDPVTLTAPAGFAAYRWSNGLTTQSITVEDGGNYNVTVSNDPNWNVCSATSSTVSVVRNATVDLTLYRRDNSNNFVEIVNGETIESCEDGFTLLFGDDGFTTGNLGLGDLEITRDGTELILLNGTTQTILDESGTYTVTWNNDTDAACAASSSVSFTLNVVATPDQPIISGPTANQSEYTICAEDGAVTLTAPAGFAQYRWRRNTVDISNSGIEDNFNTITVTQSGTYSVVVSNSTSEDACFFSSPSNSIDVNAKGVLDGNDYGFMTQSTTVACGPGTVEFEVTTTFIDIVYQLIDRETGLTSGAAVTGNGGTIRLVSDQITEETVFDLQLSYVSGLGCTAIVEEGEIGIVNNVILELEGNQIVADIQGNFSEIKWFRNDVELRNQVNDDINDGINTIDRIIVLDAAVYSVEVDFGEGCVIASNTVNVDEGGRIVSPLNAANFSAYPNPAKNVANIKLEGGPNGTYEISIVNVSGQVVLRDELTKEEEEQVAAIDISQLESGIYTMILRRGRDIHSIRIIKQ